MSTTTEISGFDEYRKTCSVLFGSATASQLKYLEASIQLQQTALTSCDGIIANQLNWIQNYVNKNKDSSLEVYRFLNHSQKKNCQTYQDLQYWLSVGALLD